MRFMSYLLPFGEESLRRCQSKVMNHTKWIDLSKVQSKGLEGGNLVILFLLFIFLLWKMRLSKDPQGKNHNNIWKTGFGLKFESIEEWLFRISWDPDMLHAIGIMGNSFFFACCLTLIHTPPQGSWYPLWCMVFSSGGYHGVHWVNFKYNQSI